MIGPRSDTNQTELRHEMDIDADMTSWETPSTVLEVMLHKERTTYAQHDYFARSHPVAPCPDSNPAVSDHSGRIPVDPACRSIMAKWCVSLCNFCNYDRYTMASVMSCVDRFVATPQGSRILFDRNDYQLVVMASLYLMTKVLESQALEPSSMAKLSRGKYSKADIERMELEILMALDWCVTPPTPMAFAHEFVKHLGLCPDHENDQSCGGSMGEAESNDDSSCSAYSCETAASCGTTEERIIELIHCQIKDTASDYELSCLHRPSHVAFAALRNALESLDIDSSGMESMNVLKEKLDINADGLVDVAICYISEALLRIVSSCEEGLNNWSSALLMQRCCGLSSSSVSHDLKQRSGDPSLTKTASSCIYSSPRAVAC